MRDWYCRVLSAHPALDDGRMAFLAFDHEHHRVGIFSLDQYDERKRPTIGLQHRSFTYDSLPDLMDIYEDLKADGILPVWSVHHGPTVSMHYADPDGNHVELQIDVFATSEEATAFMEGPVYRSNPTGNDFDPDEMVRQLRAGADVDDLIRPVG